MNKVMVNNQSREHSLFYAYVWSKSNLFDLHNYLSDDVEDLLFIKRPNSPILHVYYEKDEYQKILDKITKSIEEKPEDFDKLIESHEELWERLLPYVSNGVRNISELKDYYEIWWKWWSTMGTLFAVPLCKIEKKYIDKAMEIREVTEKYSDEGDRVFTNFFKNEFSQYLKYMNVMTPDEIFDIENGLNEDKKEELDKRLKEGYAFYNYNLYNLEEIEIVLSKNDIKIEELDLKGVQNLKGQIVSKGVATGKVRLITEKSKIQELEEGEVLVTYMTSPDFLPAMKKAAAFVTNEGGMMCHAAITARELGKPAVVGTKIATEFLKDGDEVEVDANEGIVKIIKKANT